MARRLGVVLFILLSLQLLSSYSVHSRTSVENLPGFDDPLPFKLETGYVGTGQNEDIQLLYYFVESERNPEEDPLMLWIAGGPVCSTLGAFFRENGPLQFDYKKSTEEKPVLELNPYSWTKVRTLRLVAGKTAGAVVTASKEMDKKKRPISRSYRASL